MTIHSRFAKIARPLHDLTKRSTLWNWTTQHQDSFDELKFKMITAPVLIQPDLSKTFIIQTDASDEGLGVVLTQRDDQRLKHPITYTSRKLSDLELKYTTTEKECLAVRWAIEHFDHYLCYQPFEVMTDHSALN